MPRALRRSIFMSREFRYECEPFRSRGNKPSESEQPERDARARSLTAKYLNIFDCRSQRKRTRRSPRGAYVA